MKTFEIKFKTGVVILFKGASLLSALKELEGLKWTMEDIIEAKEINIDDRINELKKEIDRLENDKINL